MPLTPPPLAALPARPHVHVYVSAHVRHSPRLSSSAAAAARRTHRIGTVAAGACTTTDTDTAAIAIAIAAGGQGQATHNSPIDLSGIGHRAPTVGPPIMTGGASECHTMMMGAAGSGATALSMHRQASTRYDWQLAWMQSDRPPPDSTGTGTGSRNPRKGGGGGSQGGGKGGNHRAPAAKADNRVARVARVASGAGLRGSVGGQGHGQGQRKRKGLQQGLAAFGFKRSKG